jgi:hypothetical protein
LSKKDTYDPIDFRYFRENFDYHKWLEAFTSLIYFMKGLKWFRLIKSIGVIEFVTEKIMA